MSNQEQQATNKVLDRVKKMLALGNCMGTTEHERDTAMKMAYSLLAKNNLKLEDVKDEDNESNGPRGVYKQAGWSMLWAKHATHIIADLFFCEYYYSGKINATKCYHHFVGKEGNARTAMHITDHVVASILKEGRARFGDNLCPGTRSFALGCIDRLQERAAKLKREAAQENDMASTARAVALGTTALVLADVYKSEQEANEALLPATLKTSKSQHKRPEAGAYHAGVQYSDKLSLNVQVGNSSANRAKIG